MFTLDEGKAAVRIARDTIDGHVTGKPSLKVRAPKSFSQKAGVFVTINTHPAHGLRGCIGFPEPTFELLEALTEAAISACSMDPRFPPVREQELGKIVIEVSLLSPPELVVVKDPKAYLDKIKIGRDGLIIDAGFARGLLLPQVPVEWEWDVEQFLEHTCMKAGLPPEQWKKPGVKFYSFTAQIFAEGSPHGNITEKDISQCK